MARFVSISLFLIACGSLPKTSHTTGSTTGSTTSSTTGGATAGTTAGTTTSGTTGSTTGSDTGTTSAGTPTRLWHASYGEHKLRAFDEAKWGLPVAATGADAAVAVDLSACNNATPNAMVQDGAGNLIFTDRNEANPAQGKVILVAADKLTGGGTVTLAASDCQELQTGLNEVIGLALDGDGRSVFVAHANGISYLHHTTAGFSAGVAIVPSGTFSGLLLDGDRLYAVDYAAQRVLAYALDGPRTTAMLKLSFYVDSQPLMLAEGIAIIGNTLWVADNSADILIGIAITSINGEIIAHPGTDKAFTLGVDVKLLNNLPPSAALHCPGALATDHLGNLWVNVQGASADDANCETNPDRGNLYKFTPAQLNFTDASSDVAPALQISNIASVPGFGGLAFGH